MPEIKRNPNSNIEVLHQRGNLTVFKFSSFQVEAAKLRAQGHSLTQIAERLNTQPPHVSVALKKFRGTAEHMRQAVKELSKVHYFDMLFDRASFEARVKGIKQQMLQEGFWPFSRFMLPRGFILDEAKRIKLHPQEAENIKSVFKRVADGEVPRKVAMEKGIKKRCIYNILRNPMYIGYTRAYGKRVKIMCDPIIDEETWNRVQTILDAIKTALHMHALPSVPLFGFRRVGADIIIDDEKTGIICQIFKMRIQRRSIGEISQAVGIHNWKVHTILHNPAYKKVVGANLWEKARGIRITHKESAERRGAQIDAKIVSYLRESHGATTGEIMKGVKLSRSTVKTHLRWLQARGLTYREPQRRRGKWYWLETVNPK